MTLQNIETATKESIDSFIDTAKEANIAYAKRILLKA